MSAKSSARRTRTSVSQLGMTEGIGGPARSCNARRRRPRTFVQGRVPKRIAECPIPRNEHGPARSKSRPSASLWRAGWPSSSAAMRSSRDFAHLTAHDLKEPLSTIALFADVLASAHAQDLNPGGRRLLERLEAGVERMRLTMDTALAGADRGEHPVADWTWAWWWPTRFRAWPRASRPPAPRSRWARCRPCSAAVPSSCASSRTWWPTRSATWRAARGARSHVSARRHGRALDASRWRTPGSGVSVEDARSGSGLGLGICREIAERHGGEISIDVAARRGRHRDLHPGRRRAREPGAGERVVASRLAAGDQRGPRRGVARRRRRWSRPRTGRAAGCAPARRSRPSTSRTPP